MYEKKSVGKRIRILREKSGNTQLELARSIGISVDTVRKLEQGKRMPSIEVVKLLSEYFDVSTDYIILGGSARQHKELYFFEKISPEKKEIVEKILQNIQELIY